MINESKGIVDRRVVRESYRNYDLIARHWKGKYSGRIWKKSIKVHGLDGDSIDELIDMMRRHVDKLIVEKRTDVKDEGLSVDIISHAVDDILYLFTDLELELLTKHAKYEAGVACLDELKKALRLKERSRLNSLYKSIGQKIADELGLEPAEIGLVEIGEEQAKLSKEYVEVFSKLDL